MPASEIAYGENHPATLDRYKDEAGRIVTRETIRVPERAQLSGEAFGDAPVERQSFERAAPQQEEHDFSPDK